MTNQNRVIAYLRVSTIEQAESGAGLEAQREVIEAEATRRGWVLVKLVTDAGYSAKNLRRPGILAVLEALHSGEADALVVAKLDRLSRSMLDFASLMDRSQREGWALVALDLGVDTTTPAGEMMANVLAVFANFERRLIGQRTRDALAVKRSQGVRLGRPPNVTETTRIRIRELRNGGRTLRQIADSLNEERVPTPQGGRRWYASTIRGILKADQRSISVKV
jgi:DNA invertase Pin-like site-specific DNA recombinase